MSSRPRLGARTAVVTAVLVCAASLAVASAAASASRAASRAPVVRVVAAENVWGNLASQIGGTRVAVTSLIANPNADPHEYVASAEDAAAIARSRIVIENGAGYDAFMGQLVAGSGAHPQVVVVQQVLGIKGPNPNPHFWYDTPALPSVAAAFASALSAADPSARSYFRANLMAFDRSLGPLRSVVAAIRRRYRGTPVAYTERLPGYLLAAAGLAVKTPPGFARAVELGSEPSPADTVAMDRLVSGRHIAVLVYNTQAVSPVTASVRGIAAARRIPVVGVSETLPSTYHRMQDWLLAEARALNSALGAR